MKRLAPTKKIIFCFLISIILMSHAPVITQESVSVQQYAFKAAFLFHFIEYIDWKNNAESGTFNFGVLGKSPIAEQMKIIASDRLAKNKKINVKEYTSLDEIGFCYILFVPKNSPVPLENVVSAFENEPVLIVTEEPEGSLKKGAFINFFIDEGKLKFEINLKSINKAGIKISSQLLQHAVVVNEQ